MLTESMITGIRNYKYSCVDSSPLAINVMHPFWNWLVQFYPTWWAPNAITLVGFILTILHFGILSYYNPNFNHPSAVPHMAWLVCGVLVFLAHTLDGTDGKQARRIQLSSPLGELFDHGCDSLAAYLIPAVIFSMSDSSFIGWRLFIVFWGFVITFYTSHLEKYFSGVLFLPWTYDAGQLMVAVSCILAFIFSPSIMSAPIMYNISAFVLFEVIFYISLIIHVANVFRTVISTKSPDALVDAYSKLWYWVSPCLPMLVLLMSSLVWATFTADHVLINHPRLFFYCVATIASNVCCKLILAHLCDAAALPYNSLVLAYVIVTVIICTLPLAVTLPDLEDLLLRLLALYATCAHLHYAVNTICDVANVLGISPFTVKNTPQNDIQPDAS